MIPSRPTRVFGLAILAGWAASISMGWLEPAWTDWLILAGGALLASRPGSMAIVVVASLALLVGSGTEILAPDWPAHIGWSGLGAVAGYSLVWMAAILLLWSTHVLPWGKGKWSQGTVTGLAYMMGMYPTQGFWGAAFMAVFLGAMMSGTTLGRGSAKTRGRPVRRPTPQERIARLRDPDPWVTRSEYPRAPSVTAAPASGATLPPSPQSASAAIPGHSADPSRSTNSPFVASHL